MDRKSKIAKLKRDIFILEMKDKLDSVDLVELSRMSYELRELEQAEKESGLMINFNMVIDEFKKLGFDYDLFGADAGYRDIFTNSDTHERIIFYDEIVDGEHSYCITTKNDVVGEKLHRAIQMYIDIKWGV